MLVHAFTRVKTDMHLAVERQSWGRLSTGQSVDLFTLRNAHGLTARVTSFGATLVSLEVPDKRGRIDDVVLGFDNSADYERNHPYFGSTIGRFANRIRGGCFELDGRTFQLAANAGPHHHHGGRRGFSHRVWRAEPTTEADRVGVALYHESPDGDENYPGNLEAVVTYWLDNDNRLRIDYQAHSDAPTHINLTNHSYFNLTGRGDVLDHLLQLQASRYTPIDATGIPTGILAEVAGTPMDFTIAKPVGRDIEDDFEQLSLIGGYDHNFVIDGWDRSLREFARLEDPVSGRTMTLATTCPGVQVYTANGLAVTGARGGGEYHARDGLCLEPQFFPDTPNQSHFPSTRLDPGDVWQQATAFTFTDVA